MWKLAQSPLVTELHASPGNPGIAGLAECHPVLTEDGEGVLDLATSLDVDLVVVGPEAPLVGGLADVLRRSGIAVFGPSAGAAAIEGSKAFAKDVLQAAGVASAGRLDGARAPCVVKADGLAAGKGVFVCRTQPEADAAVRAVARLGSGMLVEELLEGVEVSLFAVCDGRSALPLVPAQDFKRARDGDEGPNTGGMGSYAPAAALSHGAAEQLVQSIHVPVLRELERRGVPFIGLLYAGLMVTDGGPRVLEFNCRFGDPETQSILPLLASDLLEALGAAATGDLSGVVLDVSPGAAVTVVLAARSYPGGDDRGTEIAGVDAAVAGGALVFHGGTALQADRLVTNGGRVLGVTGVGETVAAAREAAYAGVAAIECEALRWRSDIALAVGGVGTRARSAGG